tara:strand:+ start:506 stop:1240 length:735 start_codon:yes stop_codon:yes gene_type:complete
MKHNIKKIRNDLKTKGYYYFPKFFKNNVSFKNLNYEVLLFLQNLSKKKYKKINDFDKNVCSKFKKNKNISAYLNDNLNLSPSLKGVFGDKKILKFMRSLMRAEKKPIIANNPRLRVQIPGHDKVSNLPWHKDIHYNTIKRSSSLVFWVSLGKIDKDMGPVVIKSNSHKIKKVKKIFIKKANGYKVPAVEVKNISEKSYKNIFFPTKPGDVMIFDLNLIHRSGYNNSKDKVKWSAQARYHVPYFN